jgi:hypothetical protein
MLRCPFCRSAETRWDVSGDHLSCDDCDRRITIHREPPTSYDTYVDAPSAGRLERWIDGADASLAADRTWLFAEITRLDNYRVRVLGSAGKATRCTVTRTILGWFATMLWNIARARSSEADLVVRPSRQRATAFAGYRHAAAAALSPAPLLGLGAGLRLGGARATHGLRGGLQFGRIACSPDANRSGAACGEDELLDRIDLDAAVRAAGISDTDLRLLELTDVGVLRSRARRTKRGIALALEPLSVPDALERLRGLPDVPRTPHEARKRIQRARDAMRDALRERGLIPPRQRRAAPAATTAAAVRPPMQEWV